jgi:RNA polymerase sigma-70 factor (ECF subfamily)
MFRMNGAHPGDPLPNDSRITDRGSSELAARLRARDASALLELFEQEEKRAFALAFRVTGDAGRAEDAVQEAFAQLWERSEQIRPDGGRVESLLMTIVYRRAIDQVRRGERTALPLPDPDVIEQIDERATDMLDRVEELMSTARLRTALQEALATLPQEQRVILDKAYNEQLSLREIAEQESVPIGTVKSRLRLAMAKLSKSLKSRAES